MVGMTTLGVGFPYIASVPADFYELGVLDFVEITPEALDRQQDNSLLVLITAALQCTHTIWSWCIQRNHMPPREFQTTLARMLPHDDRNPLRSLSLSSGERMPPEAQQPTVVIESTPAVRTPRSEQRPANTASVTLSVLSEPQRRAILNAWIKAGGETLSFFRVDPETRLDFIAKHLPNPSLELNVCRLERATIRARTHAKCFQRPDPALFDPERVMRVGRHAQMVTAVLVAPGLQSVHRAATALEQALWSRLAVPAQTATLLREGFPRELLETMLHIGALEYAC